MFLREIKKSRVFILVFGGLVLFCYLCIRFRDYKGERAQQKGVHYRHVLLLYLRLIYYKQAIDEFDFHTINNGIFYIQLLYLVLVVFKYAVPK